MWLRGGGARRVAEGAEDGDFAAVFQRKVGGRGRVAERGEQPPEPLALLEDALPGAPLALEFAAEAEVLGGESAEFGVGRARGGGLGLLAPALDWGLDVAGEDLRQVVVAVELVLVVDAG